ncbi:MAG: DUF3846 domain-containing protein [Limnohabitans sp.]
MWATLKVDGTFEKHEGVPTLEEMQEFVRAPQQAPGQGMVEVVELKHGIDMWLNEEGKYVFGEPAPMEFWNRRATMFAHEAKAIYPSDMIVGDVLFTGGNDDEGETVGLSDEQLAYVAQSARMAEIGRPGSGIWNMTGISL